MTPLKVSVVVPVYDCVTTVATALGSALDQSIDPELVEVIAVDDGSTDGSAAELDRLAALHPRLTVLKRANSGGPGGPRNTGIARARGEYLFFLDADDRLGHEALERMCAAADAHGTDVVIGRYVGVGRPVAKFTESIAHVSVDDPDTDIYAKSLTAQKLFRRSVVEEHRIRFPEGAPTGEDKVFTAHALLHASGGVSVVADHDCYYLVERDDGSSLMQNGLAARPGYYAKAARPLLENVVAHRDPGPIRDRMLVRHFHRDVLHAFNDDYPGSSEERRRRLWEEARALCDEFLTEPVLMAMPPKFRLIAHCLRGGDEDLLVRVIEAAAAGPVPVVVDKDRAHARYPGFREPSAGVPDDCFDVTDRLRPRRSLTSLAWSGDRLRVGWTAEIPRLDAADRTVTLLLRPRKKGAEQRIAAEPDGNGGTGHVAGIAAADGGVWDLHIEVRHGQLAKEARLGAARAEGVAEPAARFVRCEDGTGAAVEPFFTREYGNLSFTVTRGTAGAVRLLRFEGAEWAPDGRLRVRGRLPVTPAAAALVRLGVAIDHRTQGTSLAGEVVWDDRSGGGPGSGSGSGDGGGSGFSALLDPRGLAAGRWDAWLEITVGGERSRVRIPMRRAGRSSPVPCAPLGLRNASFYRTEGGNLSVEVVPGKVPALARSAKRRLRAPLPKKDSAQKPHS
ncbi:glycosyltransferase family 2 protein [Actinomadura sp. LOL_016]|uniref:glycosyltransferase family 2 protein n=1 Tax=unclassified Actinomadura TaxID=2626254 RepID=UPI003A809C4B